MSTKGTSGISSFRAEEFFKSSAAKLDPQGLLKVSGWCQYRTLPRICMTIIVSVPETVCS